MFRLLIFILLFVYLMFVDKCLLMLVDLLLGALLIVVAGLFCFTGLRFRVGGFPVVLFGLLCGFVLLLWVVVCFLRLFVLCCLCFVLFMLFVFVGFLVDLCLKFVGFAYCLDFLRWVFGLCGFFVLSCFCLCCLGFRGMELDLCVLCLLETMLIVACYFVWSFALLTFVCGLLNVVLLFCST